MFLGCDIIMEILGMGGEGDLEELFLSAETTMVPAGAGVEIKVEGAFSGTDERLYVYNLTWTSSDESVATVDTEGKVTAQWLGQAFITATKDMVSGSITITVTEPNISSFEVGLVDSIFERDTRLTLGSSQQYKANVGTEEGGNIDITEYATWSSSNTDAVTVNSSGLVTAVDDGTADIYVTYNGLAPNWNPNVVAYRVVDVTLNYPAAPEGAKLLYTGLYDDDGNTIALLPANTSFSGGTVSTRLVHTNNPFFDAAPTSQVEELDKGSYSFWVIIDMDGDEIYDETTDVGAIQAVLAIAGQNLEIDIPATSFFPLVTCPLSVSASSLPDTAILFAAWTIPGTPVITELMQVFQYLNDDTTGQVPPGGFRSFSWTFGNFFTGGALSATNFNGPLIPGVYDLTVGVDADNDSTWSAGDYRFGATGITVDGTTLDIAAQIANATPLP